MPSHKRKQGALMSDQVSYIDVPEKAPSGGNVNATLPTITQHSTTFKRGVWSGVDAEEAIAEFENLYNTGLFLPTNFGIKLRPYDPDGELADLEIQNYSAYELGTLLIPDFNTSPEKKLIKLPLLDEEFTALPFLCVDTHLTGIDAITESVNAGHYQLNYITGNTTDEITVNMHETRACDIFNSVQAIKKLMFKDDGTQALPNDYLMYLTLYTYDQHSRSTKIIEQTHLVALKASSLDLSVENRSTTAIVPLTFIKMFPNLVNS